MNLDLAKVYYSYGIYNDKEIPGTIPRNSTIPEELGRVQYLLTDKTGTLTKNDMIFKKVALEFSLFDEGSLPEIKEIIKAKCEEAPGPLSDTRIQSQANDAMKRAKRRDQDFVIKDLILALGLCHNVTPVYEREGDMTSREFQASSPDEVALVKFADTMGIQLIQRDQKTIVIQPPGKSEMESYEILENFPFSSDTKRMGIILRHIETDTYIFYLKGAEVVMQSMVRPSQRDCILE